MHDLQNHRSHGVKMQLFKYGGWMNFVHQYISDLSQTSEADEENYGKLWKEYDQC